MSIASQCSECCTCPTATVEWDSRSGSKTKADVGYYEDGEYWISRTTTYTEGIAESTSNEEFNGSCPAGTSPYRTNSQTFSGSGYTEITEETFGGSTSVTRSGDYKIVLVQTDYTESTYLNCDYSVLVSIRTITENRVFNNSSGVWDRSGTDNIKIFYPTASEVTYPISGTLTNGPGGTSTTEVVYAHAVLDNDLDDAIESDLPPWDNDFNDTPGSYADTSEDGFTRSIRESRYRLRFKIPKVKTGKSLRASWVERFIAEAGVAVTSVEVYARGVYRPTVTISTSPLGTNAAAIAVMASDGTVASLSILNPGAGYIPLITFTGGGGTGAAAIAIINSSGAVTGVTITSGGSGYTSAPTVAFTNVTAPRVRATGTATVSGGIVTGINIGTAGDFRPTVTVQTATGGGTTSTGWIATLAITGEVASIAGGNAGNYLPTLAFSAPGGSPAGTTATATCTVDPQGGIATVTMGTGGTKYTSEPTLTITPKVSDSTAADLIIHLGTEIAKCAVWNGTTLGGKWVKREVVDAGHALTSIEVVHGGTGFTTAPTVTITGGGGAGATATASVSGGVITGITLGAAGTGYKTNPTITLSGGGGAGGGTVLLAAHFGTETEYADGAQPAGTTPLGYVDGVTRTYPLIGSTGTAPWKYYEIAVPSSDGTTLVANVRTVCDGTSCP